MRGYLVICSFLCWHTACDGTPKTSQNPKIETKQDAAMFLDAMSSRDATPQLDATSAVDAMTSQDASTTVDAGMSDAGADPCAEYLWMRATFVCTGQLSGRFSCDLVTPSQVRPDGCDLECNQIGGSQMMSIRPLPGGSTTEIQAPTSFSFLAPPSTCNLE